MILCSPTFNIFYVTPPNFLKASAYKWQITYSFYPNLTSWCSVAPRIGITRVTVSSHMKSFVARINCIHLLHIQQQHPTSTSTKHLQTKHEFSIKSIKNTLRSFSKPHNPTESQQARLQRKTIKKKNGHCRSRGCKSKSLEVLSCSPLPTPYSSHSWQTGISCPSNPTERRYLRTRKYLTWALFPTERRVGYRKTLAFILCRGDKPTDRQQDWWLYFNLLRIWRTSPCNI